MKPTKYTFTAIYENKEGGDVSLTIVASDFTEALKKAEDPATLLIAQAGPEDSVELVELSRDARVDVE